MSNLHTNTRESALRGMGVALVTPFARNGGIASQHVNSLMRHLQEGGTDFYVVMGSTGEAATMLPEEKRDLLRLVAELNTSQKPIVVGMSSNNTHALLRELEQIDHEPVDYILSAVPHYNKPSQEGIYQHFMAIAEAAPRPIILYNIPGRTGMNMTAETTLRLAMEILAGCPEGFSVLSGDDALTLPMISMGAHGVISVTGNVVPRLFGEMVHRALENDCHAAAGINRQLLPLYKALFAEGNPAGVKAALSLLGICEETLRMPLLPMSREGKSSMEQVLEGLGLRPNP